MKVSELIKELAELDPDDECVLCINNQPITSVARSPYYWDGRLELIERDRAYIPIKVGYKMGGSKISFHYDTIEDALMDNPEAELELSGITYQGKIEERYAKQIEEWKRQGQKFQEWKKSNLVDYEQGKRPFTLPEVRWKTRFTCWLRRLGLIDA
jgi:hypothetical protein